MLFGLSYSAWHNISSIVSIISVVIALLGSVGVYYFGNKIKQLDDIKIATLNSNLEAKSAIISELESIEQQRKIDTNELEIVKNTPPSIIPSLVLDKNKDLYLIMDFQNEVPVLFRYSVHELSGRIVGGVTLSHSTLYPKVPTYKHKHGNITNFKIPQDKPVKIELSFEYYSIYFDETQNRKLAKKVVKDYLLNPLENTLKEI